MQWFHFCIDIWKDKYIYEIYLLQYSCGISHSSQDICQNMETTQMVRQQTKG